MVTKLLAIYRKTDLQVRLKLVSMIGLKGTSDNIISIGTFQPRTQTTFSAVLFLYPKRYFLYTFKLDFPETFG